MKIITLFTVLFFVICIPINGFAEMNPSKVYDVGVEAYSREDFDFAKHKLKEAIKLGLEEPRLSDARKKLNTSPTCARLEAKLVTQDAVGFIALLPPRITNVSTPNADEAADLLLQTAIARNQYNGVDPIHKEIILALILRGAKCNKTDSRNKTAMDYLKEKKVSGDQFFIPSIETILHCKQQHCTDKRLDVAQQFVDAIIDRKPDAAFALLGEKGKKEFTLEDLTGGMRRVFGEGLQGPAQCLAVIKWQNMDCVVCYVKYASHPGVHGTPVQVGKESGQIKAYTLN